MKSFLKETKGVIEALLIAMILRSLVVQPFTIPSGSMYPTLIVGDYLYTTKYTYGYNRHSFPFGDMWLPKFSIWTDTPQRGDVIVFRVKSGDDYIKRLIGMPNDRIFVRNGKVYINGKMLPRKKLENTKFKQYSIPTYIETLPNGKKIKIWEAMGDNSSADNTGEYIVPKGHYFFMGDNRDNSLDSRFSEIGYIAHDKLIGKARKVLFAFEDSGFLKVWEWFSSFRSDRFFKSIK